jgi:tRNA(Ile)-lysidine synthase
VRRSHPPTLLTLAARTIRDEDLIARGDRVICACSGGPDSTALLHVLARLRDRLGFELEAHGVDHGLRVEAASELASAERLATTLGVRFATTRVQVGAGSNLQARARTARYAALEAAAREFGAGVLATGHTADDRAETFLLRLLRGSGPRGLAALPAKAPQSNAPTRIRPLLRARRADVRIHLERHHLEAANDPSNLDPRFARVRVRRELLPLLTELSPRIVEHLCALADMLGEAMPPSESVLPTLGRAQRQAIERARNLGHAALRLRAKGGREVEVTFPAEGPVVTVVVDAHTSADRPRTR